jgi:hypothetical protein
MLSTHGSRHRSTHSFAAGLPWPVDFHLMFELLAMLLLGTTLLSTTLAPQLDRKKIDPDSNTTSSSAGSTPSHVPNNDGDDDDDDDSKKLLTSALHESTPWKGSGRRNIAAESWADDDSDDEVVWHRGASGEDWGSVGADDPPPQLQTTSV